VSHERSEFAQRHWIAGGILLSLLWFVAGKQSFAHGKADNAMLFQGVGVLIALVLWGNAIAHGEWAGIVSALIVACFELRSIKRIYDTTRRVSRS